MSTTFATLFAGFGGAEIGAAAAARMRAEHLATRAEALAARMAATVERTR